ncbi:hypothetical protein BASA50_000611 [Batrachochytrium salamandrivorans]|uniref:Uncharacterized protein n=1 Tax=Batrachochytrium salamandrivorans TaxID=1357716 RepID=A0ABQ8ET34_9FUNG|nr:hypothetical protein BASA50_000611 [Batrachochytrium salamandrivorans]
MRIVHLALYSTVATVANAAALSQWANPLEQNSEHIAGISIFIPESKSYQPALTTQEDHSTLVSLTRRADDSLGETSNFGETTLTLFRRLVLTLSPALVLSLKNHPNPMKILKMECRAS